MEESLAWCECDGRLVFLDLRGDRYFQLSLDGEIKFRASLGEPSEPSEPGEPGEPSELGEAARREPSLLPARAAWSPPTHTFHALEAGAFSLPDIAAAIWWQKRVERRLAKRGLCETLLALRNTQRGVVRGAQRSEKLDRTLRAFHHARVLRSAADRCLPRSIALALLLARGGLAARLVIGVRTNPFGAHSWTQHEDQVLNDSVEEVSRFTPILVV